MSNMYQAGPALFSPKALATSEYPGRRLPLSDVFWNNMWCFLRNVIALIPSEYHIHLSSSSPTQLSVSWYLLYYVAGFNSGKLPFCSIFGFDLPILIYLQTPAFLPSPERQYGVHNSSSESSSATTCEGLTHGYQLGSMDRS